MCAARQYQAGADAQQGKAACSEIADAGGAGTSFRDIPKSKEQETYMLDTILIDLDGTLFPTDQETFTQTYFRELIQKAAPYGYEKKPFIDALWAGTAAMVKNDGTRPNRDAFWEAFSNQLGEQVRTLEPILDRFYSEEFYAVRDLVPAGFTVSREIIATLREKGYTVILASNPIFPLAAYETRLDCLGLHVSDFELVTTYETSVYSKPNPDYYRRILAQAGKTAEHCLMAGNNIKEDMIPAALLGMQTYLVTDFIEGGGDADAYRHGSLADFLHLVKQLPPAR